MRLNLTLSVRVGSVIPINYQYPLSSFIYRTLQQADGAYSDWLHQQGYAYANKHYRLFTFSQLVVPKYRIKGDRLEILSNQVKLTLSFYADEAIKNFVTGLFQQQAFSIGDRKSRADFMVTFVAVTPKPAFTQTMRFKCLSPICVSEKLATHRYAQYLSPQHPKFEASFLNNLQRKYAATLQNQQVSDATQLFKSQRFKFKLLSPRPKARLVTIKAFTRQESKVKGYKFDFELTAPVALTALGYFGGFGEKTSAAGFGCVALLGE